MKQKDIAMVAVVAVFSIIVATFASNLIIGKGGGKQQQAETVDAISATFDQPNKDYFNSQSVDPTQIIRIGDNSNQAPFNQAQ